MPDISQSAVRAARAPLAVVVLAFVIGACSSKDIDPDELPAELVDLQPTLKIQRAWSTSIGDGTENLRLGLRPATDGTRIYAAAHDGRVIALDPIKGKRIWSRKTDLPLSAGPASDGKLVVADTSLTDATTPAAHHYYGELLALDGL